MSPGYYILYSEITQKKSGTLAGGPLCIKLTKNNWAVLGFDKADVVTMFQSQMNEPTQAYHITNFPSKEFQKRFYAQYQQVLLINHANIEMFLNNRDKFPYKQFLIPLQKPTLTKT